MWNLAGTILNSRLLLWSAALFMGREGPCFRCLFLTPPPLDSLPDCDTAGVIGVLPGMLGIILATEIIKWIAKTGGSLHKRLLTIDLSTMAFKTVHPTQNSDCDMYVHLLPLNQLPRPLHSHLPTDLKNHAIDATTLGVLLQKKNQTDVN